MHIAVKSGLVVGAVAGTSGLGYGIYNAVRIPTYAEVLKGTLLSTNKDEDQDKWKLRLASLKTAEEGTLVIALKAIKEAKPDANADQLIAWCKTIIDTSNKGEKDREFKNIQSYCTFSIKDKIKKAIPEGEQDTSTKWKKGYNTLKAIKDESKLDSDLKKAKSEAETEGKKTIKKWCTEAYKKPYKGDKDQDFINAQQICIDA